MKHIKSGFIVFVTCASVCLALVVILESVFYLGTRYGTMWGLIWFIISISGFAGAAIGLMDWVYEKSKK